MHKHEEMESKAMQKKEDKDQCIISETNQKRKIFVFPPKFLSSLVN
jgi:hypothetical protein